MNLFPYYSITHLARFLSNHATLLLSWNRSTTTRSRRKKLKLFRFEERWLQEPSCGDVIKNTWENGRVESVLDLSAKLFQCSVSLSAWDKEFFRDIPNKIEEGLKELERLQGLFLQLILSRRSGLLRTSLLLFFVRRKFSSSKDPVFVG